MERKKNTEWINVYVAMNTANVSMCILLTPFVLRAPAAMQVGHKIFPQSLCSCM